MGTERAQATLRDEEEQMYTETAVEEVMLVQTAVDVDGWVAVDMKDKKHSGGSCVAHKAGELELILRPRCAQPILLLSTRPNPPLGGEVN